MSFSSGTFSINSSGQPYVTGTVISSTAANALNTDLATGLSTCVLKDGTQTITANIPMSSFKLTGLAAGSAAGDSVRYEQSPASIMTTLGDWLYASAANTAARMAATASVAAHATTMDPWNARETVLTGGAVTFTDIADADYAGQVAWVYMNAAHVWTDGAVFDVQGGANYTAAVGDWVRINAVTVSTFDVTIFPALGQPISMQPITNSLGADVALNNTSNFFDGPSIAQGTAGTWFVSGSVTLNDTAGTAGYNVKLWDGTTVIDSCRITQTGANAPVIAHLSGYISSPAGNIRITVKDLTSTSGAIIFNTSGESKDSTVSAIRIA